jgi:hypothetical protein
VNRRQFIFDCDSNGKTPPCPVQMQNFPPMTGSTSRRMRGWTGIPRCGSATRARRRLDPRSRRTRPRHGQRKHLRELKRLSGAIFDPGVTRVGVVSPSGGDSPWCIPKREEARLRAHEPRRMLSRPQRRAYRSYRPPTLATPIRGAVLAKRIPGAKPCQVILPDEYIDGLVNVPRATA